MYSYYLEDRYLITIKQVIEIEKIIQYDLIFFIFEIIYGKMILIKIGGFGSD